MKCAATCASRPVKPATPCRRSARVLKLYRARLAANVAEPESVLVNWLGERPGDVVVRNVLAEHYIQTGKGRDAIREYERIAAVDRSPLIENNLAWLYHEVGDPRALETARRAYDRLPQNAAIADTYGWILLARGQVDEALRLIQQAAQAAPQHPDIQYHYAAALEKAGRRQQAVETLRKLLQGTQPFPSRADAEALLERLSGGGGS